jgi:hypothetical protein
MGITRLKRKEKRNRAVAKARVSKIKQLTARPIIKNIDIEEIKKGFAVKETPAPKAAKAKKSAESAEAAESAE